MIKVGIVMTVFNHLDYTQKAIHALKQQVNRAGEKFFEIVVVDDGSTDGTSAWIKDQTPEVHLLQGDGNLWWSGGINKGSAFAVNELKCSHILWWNNDVEMQGNYLRILIDLLKTVDNKTIIGSKIVFKNDPQKLWSMGGYFNPKSGKKGMYAWGQPDEKKWQNPLEVDWFPGMGTIIPANVFEEIGYCDQSNFPQYYGDTDFTWRAKLQGYKLICYPELVMYNDTENTSDRHNNSVKRLFESLHDIKSIYNISKDVLFVRKYGQSPMAYLPLIKKYLLYFGGFVKWKVLKLFRKSKNEN